MENNQDLKVHEKVLKARLKVNPTVVYAAGTPEGNNFANGAYYHKGDKIVLYNNATAGTLAHEMRHAWQAANREEGNFRFVDIDSLSSIVKRLYLIYYYTLDYYNNKELDSNEYAAEYCKEMGLFEEEECYSKRVKQHFWWKLVWFAIYSAPALLLIILG